MLLAPTIGFVVALRSSSAGESRLLLRRQGAGKLGASEGMNAIVRAMRARRPWLDQQGAPPERRHCCLDGGAGVLPLEISVGECRTH